MVPDISTKKRKKSPVDDVLHTKRRRRRRRTSVEEQQQQEKEGCFTINSTVTLGIYILQSLVGIHALSSCHSFLGMYLFYASRRYRGGGKYSLLETSKLYAVNKR